MVSEVNAQQSVSGQAVNALQSGQNVPLHKAVIAKGLTYRFYR